MLGQPSVRDPIRLPLTAKPRGPRQLLGHLSERPGYTLTEGKLGVTAARLERFNSVSGVRLARRVIVLSNTAKAPISSPGSAPLSHPSPQPYLLQSKLT